ncbi:MAG: hypothetical protein K9G49_10685 [Taibaiella sp.]|nr:hypothetical protein [Taibaiella sp.]
MKQGKMIAAVVLLSVGLSSCSMVASIFNAGMGVGIFIAIGIVVLIVYMTGRRKKM